MWFGLHGIRDALRGGRASALLCLVLAAFVLQTVATRSHFHFGASQLAVKADVAGNLGDKPIKAPSGHNESNCPLWHAGGICGAAAPVVASVLFFAIPDQARAPIDQRVLFVERFAAHWRSRAPPFSLT